MGFFAQCLPAAFKSMTEIINYLRDFINDNGRRQTLVFTYENIDRIPLSLEVKEIISVTANGNIIGYSLESNVLVISDSALTEGDIIVVDLRYYRYSDEELKGYIRQSLYYLTINGYKDYTINGDNIEPELSTNEKYLVADIASILILENYTTKRLPNGITISYPKNKSKRQIIEDLIYMFKGTPDYYTVMNVEKLSE